MHYSLPVKTLFNTFRQPTGWAILTSLGIHGIVGVSFDSLPILPKKAKQPITVARVELTSEQLGIVEAPPRSELSLPALPKGLTTEPIDVPSSPSNSELSAAIVPADPDLSLPINSSGSIPNLPVSPPENSTLRGSSSLPRNNNLWRQPQQTNPNPWRQQPQQTNPNPWRQQLPPGNNNLWRQQPPPSNNNLWQPQPPPSNNNLWQPQPPPGNNNLWQPQPPPVSPGTGDELSTAIDPFPLDNRGNRPDGLPNFPGGRDDLQTFRQEEPFKIDIEIAPPENSQPENVETTPLPEREEDPTINDRVAVLLADIRAKKDLKYSPSRTSKEWATMRLDSWFNHSKKVAGKLDLPLPTPETKTLDYPPEVCDADLKGNSTVAVAVLIDPKGEIAYGPEEIQSSGYSLLNRLALQSIKDYPFAGTGQYKAYSYRIKFEPNSKTCSASETVEQPTPAGDRQPLSRQPEDRPPETAPVIPPDAPGDRPEANPTGQPSNDRNERGLPVLEQTQPQPQPLDAPGDRREAIPARQPLLDDRNEQGLPVLEQTQPQPLDVRGERSPGIPENQPLDARGGELETILDTKPLDVRDKQSDLILEPEPLEVPGEEPEAIREIEALDVPDEEPEVAPVTQPDLETEQPAPVTQPDLETEEAPPIPEADALDLESEEAPPIPEADALDLETEQSEAGPVTQPELETEEAPPIPEGDALELEIEQPETAPTTQPLDAEGEESSEVQTEDLPGMIDEDFPLPGSGE